MNRTVRVLLVVGLAITCMGLATDTADVEASEELLEVLLHEFVYGDASGGLGTRADFLQASIMFVRDASYAGDFEGGFPNLAGFAKSDPRTGAWVEVDSASMMVAEYTTAVSMLLCAHTDMFKALTARVAVLESENTSLKSTVASLGSEMVSLKSTVASLSSEMVSLKSTVTFLNSKVAALDTRISMLQNQSSSTSSTSEDVQYLEDWAVREFNRIYDYVNGLNDRINELERNSW